MLDHADMLVIPVLFLAAFGMMIMGCSKRLAAVCISLSLLTGIGGGVLDYNDCFLETAFRVHEEASSSDEKILTVQQIIRGNPSESVILRNRCDIGKPGPKAALEKYLRERGCVIKAHNTNQSQIVSVLVTAEK